MAIRELGSTPTPDGRAILEDYEIDLFVCGRCSKPVAFHKVENRHTPTKAPVLVCEVGGARTPLPGYALAPVKRQRRVDLCAGCGQRIEGRARSSGGLWISLPGEGGTSHGVLVHADRSKGCEELARSKAPTGASA